MTEQALLRFRSRKHRNQTARAPELGMVVVVVLRAVEHLSPNATTNGVIDFIEDQTSDIVDVAQVYMALQAFSKPTVDLIRGAKTRDHARPSTVIDLRDYVGGQEGITRLEAQSGPIRGILDKTQVRATKKL